MSDLDEKKLEIDFLQKQFFVALVVVCVARLDGRNLVVGLAWGVNHRNNNEE